MREGSTRNTASARRRGRSDRRSSKIQKREVKPSSSPPPALPKYCEVTKRQLQVDGTGKTTRTGGVGLRLEGLVSGDHGGGSFLASSRGRPAEDPRYGAHIHEKKNATERHRYTSNTTTAPSTLSKTRILPHGVRNWRARRGGGGRSVGSRLSFNPSRTAEPDFDRKPTLRVLSGENRKSPVTQTVRS